jgi:hypothetical protein
MITRVVGHDTTLVFSPGETVPRPAVIEFAQAMEDKLRKNDHKQGWRTYPISAIRRLLGIEVSELDVALDFDIGLDAPSECVDIANFAMMLRDRINKEKKL